MSTSKDQAAARSIYTQLGAPTLADPAGSAAAGLPVPASSGLPPTVQDATTARTAAVKDNNVIIEFTSDSAIDYTVKAYSAVPLPVGAILYARAMANGQVTFVPDTGVTFETSDTYSTRGVGSFIAMKHVALNRWAAMGDLEWLIAATSIVGNPSNTDAPPTAISATADGQRLVRRAGVLAWDGEFAVAAGAADALTATLTSSDVFSLYDGLLIAVRAAYANATTTPTLAVNSGTARTITKQGNNALVVGDIKGAGHELLLRYVSAGPRWELLNPAVSGGGSSTIISTTAPSSPIAGMKWIDSVEGVEYTYYDDGDTQQWVEFGPDIPKYLFNPPSQGTSFPGSPADGDRFYRTDKGLDCFYSAAASAWLSMQEYEVTPIVTTGTMPFTGNSTRLRFPVRKDYAVYLTRMNLATFIGGTNTGSHYWTTTLQSVNAANASANISSNATNADAGSTWVNHDMTINAALDTLALSLQVNAAPTGSPGTYIATLSLCYRLIVT